VRLPSLAVLFALASGCASSGLDRQQHPDGLARILIGEESHVAEICSDLEPGAGQTTLGPEAAKTLEAEAQRDACRVAIELDPKLKTGCDLATATTTIETAMAASPPPWLSLVVQSSGAWQGGKFDAHAFASRFDFSRVLARKLGEVGDRAASFSEQVSDSFGRFAGAVQLGIDLLVAETTAASMEKLFDQPAVRALAEPTEVARLACVQLDDGQSRPLVTRRILKRAILRLDPPGDAATPGQLCASDQRPAACADVVGGTRGTKAIEQTDRTCDGRKQRGACNHLWFVVAAKQATSLQELCKNKEHPSGCERLARRGGSIDDTCRDAKAPHERAQCRAVVRWFADRNLWHPNAAENVCWSNPSRCARIKRRIMPDEPARRPVTPQLVAKAPTKEPAPATPSCFAIAEKVCGSKCPAGDAGCEAALSCVSATCELLTTRGETVAVDDAKEVARLRAAVTSVMSSGAIRRDDLVPIARGVDELTRADRALAEGVQRLPGELGSAMRQAVAGMGRGADTETLRRLEGVLAQIEAKQTKLEQAKKRQQDLADQFDAVARTAGFRVRTTDEGISIVLTNVLFEDSSSDLTDDSRAQVCKVAETLGSSAVSALLGPEYRIEIVGYSSPTAIVTSRRKDDSNMLLSIDRAYAAYDWLTKNPDKAESRCGGGRCRDARSCATTVPQDRVQVTGRGYNDAQAGTDDVLRRVEIHVQLPDLDEE
jgi:outer membrane protein OmpA-like peptidoglycan-associated protein